MNVIERHTAETTKNPARIGQPIVVEYSDAEQVTAAVFSDLIERGHSVRDAAFMALLRMDPEQRTPQFVDWLSDGTMYLDDKHAVQPH